MTPECQLSSSTELHHYQPARVSVSVSLSPTDTGQVELRFEEILNNRIPLCFVQDTFPGQCSPESRTCQFQRFILRGCHRHSKREEQPAVDRKIKRYLNFHPCLWVRLGQVGYVMSCRTVHIPDEGLCLLPKCAGTIAEGHTSPLLGSLNEKNGPH